ncbi:hypothetical protein [Vibrio campbellii]|uniref:hypothetical protein n=1 Tax=Vibrio campbellii TaxID=680 RepID=UPI0021089297|nr:hypothetical protein [Vibrio campbellii]UTZ44560.1 hypothetical protein HB764_25200 [Vibrio campbellii]
MTIAQVLENLAIAIAVGVGGAIVGSQLASYQIVRFRKRASFCLHVVKLNNEMLSSYKDTVSPSCYYHLERAKLRHTLRGEIWAPRCVLLATMRRQSSYSFYEGRKHVKGIHNQNA